MASRKARSRRGGLRKWLPKGRWKRRLFIAGGVAVLVGVVFVWSLSRRVSEFLAGQLLGPIRIYAASTIVRPAMSVEGMRLIARLRRLGYVDTTRQRPEAGEFRAARERVEI